MAKLRPLWTPGGSRSSGRAAGVTLVSGVPNNAAFYFEDFYNFDFSTSGNPSWLLSNITGTGTLTPGAGNLTTTAGVCSISSGTSSGDVSIVSSNARASAAACFGSTAVHTMAWRVLVAVITTGRQGVGMVGNTSIAVGTNWLNAPGTVLAATSYIVLVRDTGVTPAGGAAGDWCAYWGDGTTDNALPLGSAGTAVTGTAATWEIAYNGTLYSIYKDRVFIASFTPATALIGMRFDFGSQTLTAALRSISCDVVLQETALTVAR